MSLNFFKKIDCTAEVNPAMVKGHDVCMSSTNYSFQQV